MTKLLATALQPFSRGFLSVENFRLNTDLDDTSPIQRAIDALPESTGFDSGGGIIMLDGKDYRISGTIYSEKSVAIWGAGSDSGTRISLAANSNCNMLEFGKRNSSDPISLDLKGMRIEMLGAQTEGHSNIVTHNYIRHSHFIDLFVVYATGPNFDMQVDAEGGSPGRNNYFYGCAFEYGKETALNIIHDYNLNINSCYFGFGAIGQNSYGLKIDMAADRFILANSWFLQDSRGGNMYVTGPTSGHIMNNKWNGVDSSNAGAAHLVLANCSNINVGSNIFSNTLFPYCIKTLSNVTKLKVYDNQIGTVATAPFLFTDKASVDCYNNSFSNGKQSESGTSTILDTATYIEVTHGCFTTPDNVITTPQANENVWVSNIGATTFRINRAGSSGALICNWKASVKTY